MDICSTQERSRREKTKVELGFVCAQNCGINLDRAGFMKMVSKWILDGRREWKSEDRLNDWHVALGKLYLFSSIDLFIYTTSKEYVLLYFSCCNFCSPFLIFLARLTWTQKNFEKFGLVSGLKSRLLNPKTTCSTHSSKQVKPVVIK